MAELAAILATALAVVAAVPQLRRVIVAGDGHGVSLSAVLLGVVNETAWIAYTSCERLWSAAPEAVLMAATNLVLAGSLIAVGAGGRRRAVGAALLWAAALSIVAVAGGAHALGVTLGAAYAVQVAPAVWTVWRTAAPTGVASCTWAFVLTESVLWGVYGAHHADPATSTLGVVGVVASTMILVRTATGRRRAVAAVVTV